ncbi:MAG: hypothetical protein K6G11_04090 [Lachnospiraceae bacterium]|nr:hypothetical protein [Lachnospiraceae bacterium]
MCFTNKFSASAEKYNVKYFTNKFGAGAEKYNVKYLTNKFDAGAENTMQNTLQTSLV